MVGTEKYRSPSTLKAIVEHHFRVADYSRVIREAPDDSHRVGMLLHDLPRRFHQASREEQISALRDPAPLTDTRWDVLLAAVTEHIARLACMIWLCRLGPRSQSDSWTYHG